MRPPQRREATNMCAVVLTQDGPVWTVLKEADSCQGICGKLLVTPDREPRPGHDTSHFRGNPRCQNVVSSIMRTRGGRTVDVRQEMAWRVLT